MAEIGGFMITAKTYTRVLNMIAMGAAVYLGLTIQGDVRETLIASVAAGFIVFALWPRD